MAKRRNEEYRYLAVNVNKFIEHIVRHANSGHTNYVSGMVPKHKDPLDVDAKLIRKFNCDLQKDNRYRAKLAGVASVHYVRQDRLWVLMATKGLGPFYDEHVSPDYDGQHQFKQLCREGFRSSGYLVTKRGSGYDSKQHTLVSIDPEVYKDLKGYFLELAVRRSAKGLEEEFRKANLKYHSWGPVFKQLYWILSKVNERRKQRGFEQLEWRRCIKTKRRITKGGIICPKSEQQPQAA